MFRLREHIRLGNAHEQVQGLPAAPREPGCVSFTVPEGVSPQTVEIGFRIDPTIQLVPI